MALDLRETRLIEEALDFLQRKDALIIAREGCGVHYNAVNFAIERLNAILAGTPTLAEVVEEVANELSGETETMRWTLNPEGLLKAKLIEALEHHKKNMKNTGTSDPGVA